MMDSQINDFGIELFKVETLGPNIYVSQEQVIVSNKKIYAQSTEN